MTARIRVPLPAWAPSWAVTLLITIAGCGHTDSFTSPPQGTDAPFDPTPPVRLTFNSLADRGAAWLPDGSGILYSAQQLGRTDRDVCLARLPPTGGQQVSLTCDLTGYGLDSTNAIESAAPSAEGRLAFVESSVRIGALTADNISIAVAETFDPYGARRVQSVPYTIPGEPTHTAVTALRWLSPDRLVYVAGQVAYLPPCERCPPDTVFTGLKVASLDVASGATPSAIPGTDFASGVSPGRTQDELFYTVGGDTRVFRLTVSTGEITVAHDFGAAGIARDVQVAGKRMAAVVGGRVAFGVDPLLGPTQRDSGGVVHVVDLDTDADQALDFPTLLFRRPALSPAADRVVAEGYPLIVVGNSATVPDTTVGKGGDIYLFDTP
jgi:hypothetical protein